MRFCLALHSGTFLLDARAAKAAGRQKFSERLMCLNGPGILTIANGGIFDSKNMT